MPEINGLKPQDKYIQQIFEKIEDKTKLVEEAFLDSFPSKALSEGYSGLLVTEHSGDILLKARNALMRNDMQEAAHQLRRELDFCDAIPQMINSPYAISAKAGLNAINEHKSAADIRHVMQEVWLKAWAEHPTPLYDIGTMDK